MKWCTMSGDKRGNRAVDTLLHWVTHVATRTVRSRFDSKIRSHRKTGPSLMSGTMMWHLHDHGGSDFARLLNTMFHILSYSWAPILYSRFVWESRAAAMTWSCRNLCDCLLFPSLYTITRLSFFQPLSKSLINASTHGITDYLPVISTDTSAGAYSLGSSKHGSACFEGRWFEVRTGRPSRTSRPSEYVLPS